MLQVPEYLADITESRRASEKLVSTFSRFTLDPHPSLVSFHLIDAAIIHVLGTTYASRTHDQIASAAFSFLFRNRDLDHTPQYIGDLSACLRVVDDGAVGEALDSGKNFLFAGFHTGGYWSIFQWLIMRGQHIATLLPAALAHKRQELIDAAESIKRSCDSSSTLTFIDTSNPSFLVKARSECSRGRQVVLYLDGYGGLEGSFTKRTMPFQLKNAEINVSTTPFSLSRLLGVPLVAFNSHTQEVERSLHLQLPIKIGSDRANLARAVQDVYSSLCDVLEVCPEQWEGWLYISTFFSEKFRAHLESAENSDGAGASMLKQQRYFVSRKGDQLCLVDKLTYAQRQLRPLKGLQHVACT